MANKDKNLDLDDMGEFDDMDEFDENDRSPSITGYSKKKIVEDASEFTKQLAFKTGKKILPDEYGQGLDQMVEYKDYLSEIATTSKSKLGKEIGRLNKEVKKILPGKLKGLSDKLDNFLGTNQEEVSPQASQEEQRNAFIGSTLSSIFDKQLQAQADIQAHADAKEEVGDKLNLVQTKKTHELLTEIANNSYQTTTFSVQIAKEYYKKSLEIQYRSYYVQADMLETMRNYYKAFSGQFDAISKNTALPEFVKLKKTERLKEFTRNKLIDEVYNKTLGKNEYIDNLKKNFSGFISDKVDSLTSSISSVTEGLSTINEMGDAGMSGGGLAKGLAIGAATDYASDIISDKFKDKVAKNKYVQAGKGYASSLVKSPEFLFNTITDKAKKRVDQIDRNTDNPIIGTIANTLSDMFNVFKPKRIDLEVENESVLTNKNPAIFDNNVYRSITDVIPMYLRRILQKNTDMVGMYQMTNSASLKKFKSAPELHFDYTNRKLDTLGNIKASVSSELETITNKNTINTAVQSISSGKKMSEVQSKRVKKYLEKAKSILPEKDLTVENLFEDYTSNNELSDLVHKDPILAEYIKSLTEKNISGQYNRKYTSSKNRINYRLRQINDKGNIELVKEILNSILHHNSDNADLSFTTELTAPIVDSFKKYVIKDRGVLTEDNLVNYKPFAYIDAKYKEKIVPIVNALLKKIFSIISDGTFSDKSMLISSLSTIDRAIRDSDIVNTDLIKTIREYNRDLIDITKKDEKLMLDISAVTSLSVKDDDATLDTDEFFVDKSVNNEGSTLNDMFARASTALKTGTEQVKNTAAHIKADIAGVKSIDEAKKLATKYGAQVKARSLEVFNKTKSDVKKNLDEMQNFIANSEEVKELEKNVSEITGKIKTHINDKLDAIKTSFNEAIVQKEQEVIAYQALKDNIASNEDLSKTDRDEQTKGLDNKIVLVNAEIAALKKATLLMDARVSISGKVKSYVESIRVYLTDLKSSIDAELANLNNTST